MLGKGCDDYVTSAAHSLIADKMLENACGRACYCILIAWKHSSSIHVAVFEYDVIGWITLRLHCNIPHLGK